MHGPDNFFEGIYPKIFLCFVENSNVLLSICLDEPLSFEEQVTLGHSSSQVPNLVSTDVNNALTHNNSQRKPMSTKNKQNDKASTSIASNLMKKLSRLSFSRRHNSNGNTNSNPKSSLRYPQSMTNLRSSERSQRNITSPPKIATMVGPSSNSLQKKNLAPVKSTTATNSTASASACTSRANTLLPPLLTTPSDNLSPLLHSTTDSPGLSSPASSLIFERSVQDFNPNDEKIPSHYYNENYIPPVLEASANVITDNSLDMDLIDVLTKRPSARSHSMSESFQGSHTSHPSHGSFDYYPRKKSNASLRSPNSIQSPGTATGLGVSPTSTSANDRPILSFYSFADVISSENISTVNNTVNGKLSPVSNRSMSPTRQTATTPSSPRSPLLLSKTRIPLFQLEDHNSTTATTNVDDEYDEGVTVTTMGETLRRNTGELSQS